MMFTKTDNINIVIPRSALEVVFGECDRYDADETGGRILGTYDGRGDALTIAVNGIIEPGPDARRTATYFKQDGAYQERVFRSVEEREPSIEHLGNWHTHHVNGLKHLSGGDIDTYRRTVEHHNHNTSFFYALLVTEKKPERKGLQRYVFKNYMLRRGDPATYEIPMTAITLVDAPLVWPADSNRSNLAKNIPQKDVDIVNTNRIHDREIVTQFYPKVGVFRSKELGIFWRGPIALVDGSELEVVVLEDSNGSAPGYTVTLRNPPEALTHSIEALGKKEFASCRAALITTERMCNTELFGRRKQKKRRLKWMF